MSIRYPNANYPEAYPEAAMEKATDIAVNVAGPNLTVTQAGSGMGPLYEHAVTGADVKGVTASGDNVSSIGMLAPESADPKPEPETTPEPAEEMAPTDDL